MAQSITESVSQDQAPRVDRNAGVVRGVKILGFESANRRRYLRGALTKAVADRVYENSKVFVNHPAKASDERSIRDWAGNVRGVRMTESGLYGDLHLRRQGGDYPALMEAASDFWESFGLSHVASCDIEKRNGIEEVKAIESVLSVDIVTEPATNATLFESRGRTTLREISEAIPEGTPNLHILREMVADNAVGNVVANRADGDVSAAEQVKRAILSAISEKIETATGEQLRSVLKSLGVADSLSLAVSGEKQDGDCPHCNKQEQEDDMTDEEKKTYESRLAECACKNATLEAKILLLESNREASDVRVKALAAADPADRKVLLESWPAKGSGSQRPANSPPAHAGTEEHYDPDRVFESHRKRLDSKLGLVRG